MHAFLKLLAIILSALIILTVPYLAAERTYQQEVRNFWSYLTPLFCRSQALFWEELLSSTHIYLIKVGNLQKMWVLHTRVRNSSMVSFTRNFHWFTFALFSVAFRLIHLSNRIVDEKNTLEFLSTTLNKTLVERLKKNLILQIFEPYTVKKNL